MNSSKCFDVVIVSDFRFPGGTATAIAEEIAANAVAGYRTALVQVCSPLFSWRRAINPRIRTLVDAGLAELVPTDVAVSAPLVELFGPQVFGEVPSKRLKIDSGNCLLIATHPYRDASQEIQFDWEEIENSLSTYLDQSPTWAPVGPIVRKQFAALDDGPTLHHADWVGIVNPRDWQTERARVPGRRPVVGRHSRPHFLKWPGSREDVLRAYVDRPDQRVKVLGGGDFLQEMLGGYPNNWWVKPFGNVAPAKFLRGVDLFIYFTHEDWVEAFGYAVVEAMAAGAVPILEPQFAPLFGQSAIVAELGDVQDIVEELTDDQDLCNRRSEIAVAAVHEQFSQATHHRRLHDLIGPPHTKVFSPSRRDASAQRVLFVTSNGVGLGHLTRALAIAKRCEHPIEPVFVTMSQAFGVVEDAGFAVEYLPFHRYLDVDAGAWNAHLKQELIEKLRFYDARAVVFDGNVPYPGLIAALQAVPACWSVWVRRAMWRHGAKADLAAAQRYFDAVVEPGELAGAFDGGVTQSQRNRVLRTAPILLLGDGDYLPREEARQRLGLPADETCVLFQLGSGNNFDYSEVVRDSLAFLSAQPNLQVAHVDWLNADQYADLPDFVHRIREFPSARYLHAFDFCISTAGYNSFHELASARRPTVFVPNENPIMDDQLARAMFAEVAGFGALVQRGDRVGLIRALQRFLDPTERAAAQARVDRHLSAENGAVRAADFIWELVHANRADRPLPGPVIEQMRGAFRA